MTAFAVTNWEGSITNTRAQPGIFHGGERFLKKKENFKSISFTTHGRKIPQGNLWELLYPDSLKTVF